MPTSATLPARQLLILTLPAKRGEGKGRKYIRLVIFSNRHADGFAFRNCLQEQAVEIPAAQRPQGACAQGIITRKPLKHFDQITLYILKMIKCKNGSKRLIFCSG